MQENKKYGIVLKNDKINELLKKNDDYFQNNQFSNNDYAKNISDKLQSLGFRCELDDRNEKIGYKIREAASQKVPYNIIIGENEMNNGTISLRIRGGFQANDVNVDKFIEEVSKLERNRDLNLKTEF